MITIIIPTLDLEKAQKTADIMIRRAGIECEVRVLEDPDRKFTYVGAINYGFRNFPADFYVYGADDLFPSRGWLLEAYNSIQNNGVGLVAFNDGKYQHLSATHGLVRKSWIDGIYKDSLLCPDYKYHFSDVELAMIAMAQKQYLYNPRAVLLEVDYVKDNKQVNKEDEKLYYERAASGFGGYTRPISYESIQRGFV